MSASSAVTIGAPSPHGRYACPTPETWMDWADLIRAEYAEMPGLSLNAPQVERLWHLEPAWATALLSHLVETHFLLRTPRGTYVRADTTWR